MNENSRFMQIIEELKTRGTVTDYVQVAAILETNKAGISDIKAGRKKLSLDILKRMKLSYPYINIEWVIMGEGDMFHSDENTQIKSSIENKLFEIIQEKDLTIRTQAEEIGKLREQIAQSQREKGKNAGNAQVSDIASAG